MEYKKIFSYNKRIEKTAYMNWRIDSRNQIDNMINIADGYKQSTLILTQQCLENNLDKKADIIIFPILFNANHAIELYFKSIMWAINTLLNRNKKYEGKHNIYQMFTVVKSLILEFEKDKEKYKYFKKITENLEKYLNELNEQIEFTEGRRKFDGMDFSRYPFATNNHSHFYVETFDNIVVDLENFLERFKEIFYELENLAKYYSYLVDKEKDARSYY